MREVERKEIERGRAGVPKIKGRPERGEEVLYEEVPGHTIKDRQRTFERDQRPSSRTSPSTLPERSLAKAVTDIAEDIDKQLESIRDFQRRAQERNEAYFRTLLSRQSNLESAVGNIYHRGIQEQGETLLKILVAVEQMRIEQGEVARTVEALRLWAKSMQKTGLPADASLRSAVAALGQTVESLGGIKQFVELSFPLVPGICYYKVELGSEHKGALKVLYLYLWEMWKEIKSLATE